MATIIRNPQVADTIAEIDVSTEEGVRQARKAYESGDIVLLRNRRLDLDYPFLNSLDFDADGPPDFLRKIKKYTHENILALSPTSKSDVDQFVFKNVFASDAGKLSAFQTQVRSGNKQVQDVYNLIFPNYKLNKAVFTWRFTSTLFENLHWDNFHIADDFHQVRVFVNVDSAPRIWRISHKIEEYARRVYDHKGLARWRTETPDQFNFRINNKILGGMERPLMDGLDLHHLAFDQGDIWLAETRIASHQIYSGRRAIASMFYVDPTSMDDPEQRFNRRIERLHASQEDAKRGTA